MNVLILTTDQELALLRRHVLQAAGHQVSIFTTEKEAVEAAEKQVPFDVALICHRLPAGAGRKIMRIFRDDKRPGKVVYISHIYGEWPEVEADRYIVGADGPDALLRMVAESGPQSEVSRTAAARKSAS
jgi:DNA-binding NtrC family response regulator